MFLNYIPIAYGEGSRQNFILLLFPQSWHYFVQAANINAHVINLLAPELFFLILAHCI